MPGILLPLLILVAGCSEDADPLELVVRAARDARATELRWTGSSARCRVTRPVAPGKPGRCEAGGDTRAMAVRLAEIAGSIGETAGSRAVHAAGLIELVLAGDAVAARRSIDLLSDVERLGGPNAALLNDLSVAYGTLAQVSGETTPLFQALDVALRALALEPTLTEARENVEVLARALGLAVGSTALPASSARPGGTTAGASAPVDSASLRTPSEIIDHLMRVRLPDWARAVNGGDDDGARRALDEATRLAGELSDHGIVLPATAVRAVREETAATTATRVAEGIEAYAAGRDAYDATQYRDAARLLETSDALLATARSPFRPWSTLYRAAAELHLGNAETVHGLLDGIAPEYAGDDPLLEGRVAWLAALAHGRLGRIDRELPLLERAAAAFAKAGDDVARASVESLRAEALLLLGNTESALGGVVQALHVLSAAPPTPLLHSTLTFTGTRLREIGLEHAALFVQRAARDAAAQLHRPVAEVESAVRVVRASRGIEPDSTLRQMLRVAAKEVQQLADSTVRSRMAADVAEAAAELELADASPAAIALLDTVVDRFERLSSRHRVAAALALRGIGQLVLGQDSAAASDLRRSTEIVRNGAPGMQREAVEHVSAAFDVAIRKLFEGGRNRSALLALERSRMPFSPADAVDPTKQAADLPPDLAILVFGVLDDRVLSWVITRDTIVAYDSPVDRATLRRDVAYLTRAVRRGAAADVREAAMPLYRLLIAPAASITSSRERWVIVPDRELRGVPFAALTASGYGPWLGALHELSIASDVATALREPPAGDGVLRALVVGNPEFDTGMFPDLARLVAAADEAEAVAASFGPSARLLAGRAADEATVRRELPAADLFHFAGHARLHPGSDVPADLVLAPDPQGHVDSRLTASEIMELDLDAVFLVVLSACSTLAGTAGRTSVQASLADAFVRAGAQAVVASLWPVDDLQTARFFDSFYADIRTGSTAAAALRQAQRSAISAGLPPRAWAAFQVLLGRRTDAAL